MWYDNKMVVVKKRKQKPLSPKKKGKTNKEIQIVDFTPDPRRQAFAVAYFDKSSDTYGNALQSGLKAGFSQEYSESILSKKTRWLAEIVGKMDLLEDLQKNLKYHVNLPTVVQAMGPFGPLYEGKGKNKKPVMVESNVRLKLRQEITMWGLEKLHPEFKKREKDDPQHTTVEIKQVIILSPDGKPNAYNSAATETVRSLPKAA